MRRMEKAAVIGSGIMGGGIAALLASAGIPTLLLDIVPFDLKEEEKNDPKARNRIVQGGLDAAIKAKPPLFMDKKNDAELISIGNLEDDIDKLKDCDWIVEVVVEKLEIKQDLFKKIDGVRKAGSIISSNTSGIPLNQMSKDLSTDMCQHFLGTHFFNPVRHMHLLEIIPGPDTLPEVLNFMADFGERFLGKGIVWAKDTPNFVGNRIGVQNIGKAMQAMLEHGLSIPDVDAIFGPPTGRPKTAVFKTSDLVGLDTMKHVADNCYNNCPHDENRATMAMPDFVKTMVEEKNLLGNKTKAGFYTKEVTPEFKQIRKVINPQTLEYEEYGKPDFPCLEEAKKKETLPEKIRAIVYGDDKGAKYAWDVTSDGLIYAASRIPEIADTIVDIDNAMRWGFNWELGPFETWDAIGVKESVEKMEADGLSVPQKIKDMLNAGATTFYKLEGGTKMFFDFATSSYKPVPKNEKQINLADLKANNKVVKSVPSCSLIDLGDGVFNLEFHSKMNAINNEMVEFMAEANQYVRENGVGLVIGNQASGMPAPFSAGGDLSYMLSCAKDGRFSEIDQFIKNVHTGMLGSKYAPYPVVAAPHGLALGGGCEVCLGANRIVAHAELYMGLVEIGVGVLPSGGGCMNLWKKMISGIPANVKDPDLGKYFVPAFMNIAMAKVSGSAAEATGNGFLNERDRIVFNRDHLIGEAKREVLRMVADGYAPPRKKRLKVFGEPAWGMVNAEIFNMHSGNYVSDYDAFLARRIAFVLGGGYARTHSDVDEQAILNLEREAFIDFLKQEKTMARIDHMLKTGKPLRN